MPIVLGGVEYVKTSEACERLAPDVTPGTLRNWTRGPNPRLRPLRRPDGTPVRLGREYVYAWDEVVEAEFAARASGTGRPRGA